MQRGKKKGEGKEKIVYYRFREDTEQLIGITGAHTLIPQHDTSPLPIRTNQLPCANHS